MSLSIVLETGGTNKCLVIKTDADKSDNNNNVQNVQNNTLPTKSRLTHPPNLSG